jgi:hypothetical protein
MFDPTRDALLPRDRRGVVFLDYDPDAFTLLLRYLRELKAAGGEAQGFNAARVLGFLC